MLLNGMFAFRKTIVQIKRNPDTSTESIADQQPSTYPQHLYKYVSLTTAVQISRLFDILMSHRLYFPRYTELNDPLEGAAIDIPVGGYAGSSIYEGFRASARRASSKKRVPRGSPNPFRDPAMLKVWQGNPPQSSWKSGMVLGSAFRASSMNHSPFVSNRAL